MVAALAGPDKGPRSTPHGVGTVRRAPTATHGWPLAGPINGRLTRILSRSTRLDRRWKLLPVRRRQQAAALQNLTGARRCSGWCRCYLSVLTVAGLVVPFRFDDFSGLAARAGACFAWMSFNRFISSGWRAQSMLFSGGAPNSLAPEKGIAHERQVFPVGRPRRDIDGSLAAEEPH